MSRHILAVDDEIHICRLVEVSITDEHGKAATSFFSSKPRASFPTKYKPITPKLSPISQKPRTRFKPAS